MAINQAAELENRIRDLVTIRRRADRKILLNEYTAIETAIRLIRSFSKRCQIAVVRAGHPVAWRQACQPARPKDAEPAVICDTKS